MLELYPFPLTRGESTTGDAPNGRTPSFDHRPNRNDRLDSCRQVETSTRFKGLMEWEPAVSLEFLFVSRLFGIQRLPEEVRL